MNLARIANLKGQIDLDRLVLVIEGYHQEGEAITLKIKRATEDQINIRKERKFNLGKEYKLVKSTDYEWLSLNWRNYRVTKIDNSYRKTILQMIKQDY